MCKPEGYAAQRWILCASILVILVRGSYSGFACLSNPCLFGICIDDINSTFSCYCIDGYTGSLCQTNWDECWSNPCFNGATCFDGIADFNCSCSSGFEGEFCEENVNECSSNPCNNNGSCFDGVNGYSCLCLPGYSGQFCELDISVCNDTEEIRCENGGLCIEGEGMSFHCYCLSGWTGVQCELDIDECASSPCKNGAVCLDFHANYSCACPFGFAGRNCEVELEMCGETSPCENEALCLVEDWLSVCYCVPDFHGERCQFQYDECLLGPGCKNGGTCIDGVDGYTCSCPPDLTGDFCECLILAEDDLNCSYVGPTFESMTPPTVPRKVPISTTIIIPDSSLQTEPVTPKYTTRLDQESPALPSSTPVTAIFVTSSEFTTSSFTTVISSVTLHSTLPPPTEDYTEILLDDTTLKAEAVFPTTKSPDSHDVAPATVGRTLKPVADDVTEIITEIPTTAEVPALTTLQPVTSSTEPSVLQTTSELFFPTEEPGSFTTESTSNCRRTSCQNGGMCLNTTTGLRCVCKAGWEGDFCEGKQSVKVAAFSGQSFVSHRMGNTSHSRVDITARTVSPAGLILYAHLGPDIYVALYLDDGLLKFKFSCGLQTMLLSEVQFHINNGFDLIATVMLEFLPPLKIGRHCLATVRVNNTLAMSGEQVAKDPPLESTGSAVHLGFIPSTTGTDPPLIEGFVGCMHNLIVDMKPKNVFKDAFDSYDIRECLSLACLSNPCYSGASCIDYNNSWTCACPPGHLGLHCEKSVCENNPCDYGGTCVPFPGSGFICLCPLGKHGQFCEFDLDIGHPVFSSSVGGLSSFSAHTLPADIQQHMVISFKFIPHDMEQISLMLFVGQDGPHGPSSDHLAISFIKGYVVLTWNLGSGPRRIFTAQPIADLGHRPHVVQVGREGQKAWLVVDNLGNVTGSSIGPLTQLNTRSILYLGGHDSANFSVLPHDLPLHTGFSGCLYDARLQTGQMMIMLQQTRAVTGRSVGQCGTSLCHEHACQNGGGCIHHGATFTCLCADGWFGPSCGLKFNPCDSTQNNCSNGGTCVPLGDGYSCDCPLGTTGQFCELLEELSDVRLKGVRSYLAVAATGLEHHQSCLDIEVMPTSNQGLLVYSGRKDTGSFISLSLQGGVLELRVSPGKHRRRGEPLVIRSRRLLAMGRWHRVRAGRYGRRLFLWVEGTVNSGLLLPGETIPPSNSLVYIGGVPDLSTLPPGATSGHVTYFQGCVRRFASQWKWLQLNTSTIASARNIGDCDGTLCGGDYCDHGGTCYLQNDNQPRCNCSKEYFGERCETQISCLEMGCQNGGKCIEGKGPHRCACPVGWGGAFCETVMGAEHPHFGGESFIVIDRGAKSSKQQNALTKMELDFIYLNFTTAKSDGMLLWSSRNDGDEYIGVGVVDGLLKLVWAWAGEQPLVMLVPGGSVADGTWHDLAVSLEGGNVTVWADHQSVTPPHHPTAARLLTTDGIFYLGGFPDPTAIQVLTRGHFKSAFHGCLQKVAWGVENVVKNFANYTGQNIGVCDPFKP